EDAQHLAHVGGQQELDGLADAVVDAAAFADRVDDGGKVVVGQHHVGHVLGHVGAGDAHADADVGGLDGGRVVDAVAGHGGDGAALLPGGDDADLVLGLHAGVDAVLGDGFGQFLIAEVVQLGAGDGLVRAVDDAQLGGDGHGGVLVVAGDHDRADAGFTAFHDGGLDLRADRVDHAGQADEAQILLQEGGLIAFGAAGPPAHRGGQHPQGLVGHGLVGGQDLGPLGVGHGLGLGAVPVGGAALEHLVRGALGVLDEAFAHRVDGGHHLAGGVEGCLIHTGLGGLQVGLFQRDAGGVVDQGGLGGFAGGAVFAVFRV